MDNQLFCPRVLHIEPEHPDAANAFNFWLQKQSKISFLRCKNSEETTIRVVNKKRIIINCLSPAVCPDVEEAETYDTVGSFKF